MCKDTKCRLKASFMTCYGNEQYGTAHPKKILFLGTKRLCVHSQFEIKRLKQPCLCMILLKS